MKTATKKIEKRGKSGRATAISGALSPNERRRQTIKEEGLDGETVLSVRIKNAEFLEFADQVEAAGLKNNRALRIAARRIGGFLEMDTESVELLRDVTKQITGIGRNINQMAKIANQTNSVDHSDFLAERQKMGSEFMRLESLLQQVLNVSKRRTDGLERLKKAASE